MGRMKDVVDAWWAALEAGDYDAMAELAGPDVETRMPAGVVRGLDDLRPIFESLCEAFPDLAHEILDSVESEDAIAVELVVTGTHTGPLRTPDGEIRATGKTVVWESIDFVRAQDGKIVSWHTYYDQLAFFTQLGLV